MEITSKLVGDSIRIQGGLPLKIGKESGKRMRNSEVVIYKHPNREMKSFLTNVEISALRVEHFKKPLDKDTKDGLKKLLGLIGAQIVNEIMLIQGIREMTIKPKEILIKKEISYPWEEIEIPVIDILKRALRRKQFKVVKG
jgi:hypothetical protein